MCRQSTQRRRAQLVAQGVREVLSYLSELEREGEISSDEFWDPELRQDIEQAVRHGLDDELSSDESTDEVKELVHEIIDEDLPF